MDVTKNTSEEERRTFLLTCCRICLSIASAEYCITENMEHESTLSLHIMLERLFPTFFNVDKARHDYNTSWPSKICMNCKNKVIEAYALYEMSKQSDDHLRTLISHEHSATEPNDIADGRKPKLDVSEAEPSMEFILCDNVPNDSVNAKESSNSLTKPKKSLRIMRAKRKKMGLKERVSCEEGNTNTTYTTLKKEHNSLDNGNGEKDKTIRKRKKATCETNQHSQKEFEETEELQTKIDIYRCLLCDGPIYTSPKELTDHLKMKHPDQIRTCQQCLKVFMSEPAFQQHQYCHATGRSFFCTFCDKGFQTEQLLKNHIRTHTHRADYLCSLCGKEFNNKSNFRQHVRAHSGDKPWACEQCPSRFNTKGGLTKHQNTHTKIKAFSCDTCGSQFNKHYSLIKHKLIHTGERPFGCEICKMRFTSSYMVKRHMRTHTGEKPYKCTYCERSFAQSNDMVKHMKTHVGNNPYQCDRCEASFRLLTDLRNHYKEHYQMREAAAGSSTEDDKDIRFTSTNILKLRYEKEMGQQNASDGDCIIKHKNISSANKLTIS